ncbi:hypothetical protein H0H92_007362, partial [Tricholoma furcatifolium]
MLTRPPPLQLVYDNTLGPGLRPEPQARAQPQNQPQLEQPPLLVVDSKPQVLRQLGMFAALMYRANWRNFVIAIAGVNALRFIASGLSFTTPTLTTVHLAQISIALGALYLIIAFIQIFGVVGTAMEDIISECVTLAVSGSWISKSIFRGQFRHGEIPSTKVAQQPWTHGSLSQVLGIFIFSVLPALLFFFLVYTYYRQTIDPSHPACLNMKNNEALYVRMEACPNPSPIYNGNVRQNQSRNGSRGGVTQPIRARTPRPTQDDGAGAPLLRVSPMMRTTDSRDAYGVSPGPPSYAPQRPTTYGYGNVWFG